MSPPKAYLFVGKDQPNSVLEFWFVEHLIDFILGFIQSLHVIRIYHKNNALHVLVVMAP